MILPHEKAKWLSPEKQKWIESILREWGAWEFHGLDNERQVNIIYRLMKNAEADRFIENAKKREMCCDDIGLLINGIVQIVTKSKKKETILLRKYLDAKYMYSLSERKIAIRMMKNDDAKRCLRHWQDLVTRSLREVELLIANIFEKELVKHPKANKLKKYAFKG
ncbi:antiterminator Q family protein [Glaesserella parasuis]|uniref:antiterminator Q family protein n=1 Tax=Glaesserella parasuis TaxID=738 RepID=UPI0038536D07